MTDPIQDNTDAVAANTEAVAANTDAAADSIANTAAAVSNTAASVANTAASVANTAASEANTAAAEVNVANSRRNVGELLEEVRSLRETLQTVYLSRHEAKDQFPDKREVARRRKGTALVLAAVLFGFIQGHDLHVEECGPGSRTERLVDVFMDEPLPRDTLSERMREAARPALPMLCDVTFPTHAHGSNTNGQAVGFMIYGTAALAAVVWYRREL